MIIGVKFYHRVGTVDQTPEPFLHVEVYIVWERIQLHPDSLELVQNFLLLLFYYFLELGSSVEVLPNNDGRRSL